MIRKIPLAWLQLTREKTRLIVALAGIAFANILMFMQLGFREALFDGNVQFHQSLNGEIVVINPQSDALLSLKTFSQRRLYQVLALEEVESVHPIYIGFTSWRNPQTRKLRSIQVIGFDPDASIVNLPGVQQNLDKIKQPDVFLFDQGSRQEFGTIAADFLQGKAIATEVGGRTIKIGGLFQLGTSFGADGNLMTSDLNFFRLFNQDGRNFGLIDIGLVKLKPGASTEVVLEKLRSSITQKDIRLLSKQEFIDFEKSYWASSTAIGFIFTLGTIMAFVVGTVIVYQILYSEIADHLPEYATLKAIGYTQIYLLIVIFQQALILAILGYMPGFAFATFQYSIVQKETLLPITMTIGRALLVLLLTVLMCCISGAIAIRKLSAADPADIFN
ncbi:ABC transporter permease DevC [Gloeocapsopsis sp. IPPAS B-1203]|uniref:ABC transporter permease DevC n=1 Tax=Gloeocapsopsis sp. IPPAS B-1203 TaxID=2049454 RepID=UPI000C19178A|nr:ABC transporter permease DevC [Gloeocapsopsis sp. IPPAS B-1203]PIG92425.1 ABC transporter [Gloeocapsopsis sp. IPPAS B-1203]